MCFLKLNLCALLIILNGPVLRASNSADLHDLNWNSQSEKDLSRMSLNAIHMENIQWQHAESEHFIYHYTKRWMAERISGESEMYYNQIKMDLKIQEDRWDLKGHIFIFEEETVWKNFVERVGVDRWSGGMCSGNDVFLLSPPQPVAMTGGTLPHELTHLVIYRFVRGSLPTWMNEGIAEQQGRKHSYGYGKAKGRGFVPRPNVLAPENYIPLSQLTSLIDYPADSEEALRFYTQSMRLVQFLIEDHKQDFMEFLQSIANGNKFESAFNSVYGKQYPSYESFEEAFKKVAIARLKLMSDPKQN
jgi:hypothetical protein